MGKGFTNKMARGTKQTRKQRAMSCSRRKVGREPANEERSPLYVKTLYIIGNGLVPTFYVAS